MARRWAPLRPGADGTLPFPIALHRARLATFVAAALAVGCEGSSPEVVQEGGTSVIFDRFLVDPDDPDATVCDPFAGGTNYGGVGSAYGILGSLNFLPTGTAPYTSARDYARFGTPAGLSLFFSELNVPTRAWNLGFTTRSGQTLLTPQGNTLYEYFSIHLDSELVLGANDRPGRYQLALLSDDGSILDVNTGSGMSTLINNDGDTSTRMACAMQPVTLTDGQSVPIHLDYYQGPRFHIALQVLWREWPENDPGFNPVDIECGKRGNDYFFNSNVTPSAPKAPFTGLLARGWKVLGPENYILPRDVRENPCHDPGPTDTTPPELVVWNFAPTRTSLTITWTTSEAATSGLKWGVSDPPASTAADDAFLSVEHSATISGLAANTLYFVRIFGQDAAGNRFETGSLVARTSR